MQEVYLSHLIMWVSFSKDGSGGRGQESDANLQISGGKGERQIDVAIAVRANKGTVSTTNLPFDPDCHAVHQQSRHVAVILDLSCGLNGTGERRTLTSALSIKVRPRLSGGVSSLYVVSRHLGERAIETRWRVKVLGCYFASPVAIGIAVRAEGNVGRDNIHATRLRREDIFKVPVIHVVHQREVVRECRYFILQSRISRSVLQVVGCGSGGMLECCQQREDSAELHSEFCFVLFLI